MKLTKLKEINATICKSSKNTSILGPTLRIKVSLRVIMVSVIIINLLTKT